MGRDVPCLGQAVQTGAVPLHQRPRSLQLPLQGLVAAAGSLDADVGEQLNPGLWSVPLQTAAARSRFGGRHGIGGVRRRRHTGTHPMKSPGFTLVSAAHRRRRFFFARKSACDPDPRLCIGGHEYRP